MKTTPASRTEARNRLRSFLPHAGRTYAASRNYDHGAGEHGNVSCLSPYISHRLLTEPEVIQRVLQTHSPTAAEKFIQEVCWRTYWKGWLEMRPAVWTHYQEDLHEAKQALAGSPPHQNLYDQARSGETGIACLDDWTNELISTGYLHNHTRMWFASIWVFTLQLPWVLGADFFFRHLLDGDPASNTLSWRWVAGLQTPGKHYVARASNIHKFTSGRYNPAGQLNENPRPLQETVAFERTPYDPGDPLPDSSARLGCWLHHEDLCPEHSELSDVSFSSWAAAISHPMEAGVGWAPHVTAFKREAMQDARNRVSTHWNQEVETLNATDLCAEIVAWATRNQLDVVCTLRPAVGPLLQQWERIQSALHDAGIATCAIRRRWDKDLHPHATAGYFRFRKKIPAILRQLSG